MSSERILVSGPAHRVAIVGAFLSRRWRGEGRVLVLAPAWGETGKGKLLARPDHLRFHAELGLPLERLVQSAKAVPVLAWTANSAAGELDLPFSPIAPAQSGVEFQHYWLRANGGSAQTDLPDLSASLAAYRGGVAPPWDALLKGQMPFGLVIDRAGYTSLLLDLAQANGAQMSEANTAEGENWDLVFHCDGRDTPQWVRDQVSLLAFEGRGALEWQICVNAARRFAGLSSHLSNNAPERREYSRLAKQECERIADFEALLSSSDLGGEPSETLARKLGLFQACGRIPTEDFEFFSPAEWLCSLWGRGLRPARYDRLADRMPESDLMAWIGRLNEQAKRLKGEV